MRRFFVLLLIITILSVFSATSAFATDYLQFGRNPVVHGGLTSANLGPNEQFLATPCDFFITMVGGSGERVSGWMRAGTLVKVRKVSETSVTGKKVITWQVVALQTCGNPVLGYVTFTTEETPPPSTTSPSVNVTVVVNNAQGQQQSQYPTFIPVAPPGGYSTTTIFYGGGSFTVYPVFRPGDINITSSSVSNPTVTGGQGGNITNSGNSTATGGSSNSNSSVTNSGNSTNTNTNSNTNNNANSNSSVNNNP